MDPEPLCEHSHSGRVTLKFEVCHALLTFTRFCENCRGARPRSEGLSYIFSTTRAHFSKESPAAGVLGFWDLATYLFVRIGRSQNSCNFRLLL